MGEGSGDIGDVWYGGMMNPKHPNVYAEQDKPFALSGKIRSLVQRLGNKIPYHDHLEAFSET